MKILNSTLSGILHLFPRWISKPFAKPYVAGETIDEAIFHIKALENQGFSITTDILGEHVKTKDEAENTTRAYLDLIYEINDSNINCGLSIKPTHVGLDLGYKLAKKNLFRLLEAAKNTDSFIRIDMENSLYTDATIKLYMDAITSFDRVGPVIQAYLRRSMEDISRLNHYPLNVRICKGIYKEPDTLAFQNREGINQQFIDLVKQVFHGGGYPAIATHDISLIDKIEGWIDNNNIHPNQFEFQVLYGVPMNGKLEALLDKGYTVRQYVPFGKDWYDYSIRRLKENPKIVTYVMKNLFKKH